MRRRRFLQGVSAAVCGAAISCGTQGGLAANRRAKDSPVTLGFSLYGMRSLSPEKALRTCAKIGYDAVELPMMADWPTAPARLSAGDRKELRKILADLALSLPALMENAPLDGDDAQHKAQLDRLRTAAELGHALSPDAPPLIETILGGKPGQWEMLRQKLADRLGDWATLGERVETVIAIKAHRFGAVNTPEQVVWLVKQVGSRWLKLVYDYSHFQHRDLALADTLESMLEETRFIHLKDTQIVEGQAKFVLPGDGETDYAALLKQVHAGGYRGCVCVEVSGMVQNQAGYDGEAAARRSYENLAPIFAEAGIVRPARNG